ncbi:pyridoxamine 5'-phosphate oxidase [Mycobacteroides abscessus subsp. abscessus]|uniref:PPOX class F420-dependent oxidoreductase n=1 Tax=Mycobacteroides abscessus TaxID=36809 RepID=UPI00092851F3|nr:PPOX class F420-dependent oxidoreductase [Mycobacteroides abscessus]MDM2350378.1 PPOX class F420-dependent oxidoreductase [Mycobacteroides abscessus]MDM2360941.1 PPOX class F420-dependent oxidoreductase [Mycobacteroides abscessus]QSN53255.1 PPOX class F420-dependent oxidoreductase [Mycobacteroides abscessus subsp. abscessus]SIG93420.1 pyridoxamine 5'-phosphate oxidase [Mycobacteroides abscessus subsp. abscessus]SIH01231.1 pyridoxamine 5'-phosphate oxidase [Mycobacteroides abscessus subsp. a
MSGFAVQELAYIKASPLVRVATVGADYQPDLVVTGFDYDGTDFWIGGFEPTNTRRTRNLQSGNNKVALLFDDILTESGWTPRYLRIYGSAELVESPVGSGTLNMRITPLVSWSVNLTPESSGPAHALKPRKTLHKASRP